MKLVTDCAPHCEPQRAYKRATERSSALKRVGGACKRATERSSALGESQILGGPHCTPQGAYKRWARRRRAIRPSWAETVKREQHGVSGWRSRRDWRSFYV